MKSAEDAIDGYLNGEMIDPCDYDQLAMEKLDEFLGNDEEI